MPAGGVTFGEPGAVSVRAGTPSGALALCTRCPTDTASELGFAPGVVACRSNSTTSEFCKGAHTNKQVMLANQIITTLADMNHQHWYDPIIINSVLRCHWKRKPMPMQITGAGRPIAGEVMRRVNTIQAAQHASERAENANHTFLCAIKRQTKERASGELRRGTRPRN